VNELALEDESALSGEPASADELVSAAIGRSRGESALSGELVHAGVGPGGRVGAGDELARRAWRSPV
jgi:hypothetical protein